SELTRENAAPMSSLCACPVARRGKAETKGVLRSIWVGVQDRCRVPLRRGRGFWQRIYLEDTRNLKTSLGSTLDLESK
ncbi:hypothetical protein ACJX0J_012649, partial [Zea mays]